MLAFLSCLTPEIIDRAAMNLLDADFRLIMTPGTKKRVEALNHQNGKRAFRLLDFEDVFHLRLADRAYFKSVSAEFYSALLNGKEVPIAGTNAWEKIGAVITEFKDIKPGFSPDLRPDIGGPLAAQVSALAVRYHGQRLISTGLLSGQEVYWEQFAGVCRNLETTDVKHLIHMADATLQNCATYAKMIARKS